MSNKPMIIPQNMTELMTFADRISQSNMIPKDYQGKPENVLVACQWGAEIGLGPLQAMQNIAVINGRPSIWGDAALALVRASGLLAYITETYSNGVATCTIKRKGEHEQEQIKTFSIDNAKKANLWGKAGPWTNYPERMLQLRARGWALRDVFPDVLKGIYTREEAQDCTDEPEEVQAQPVKHPAPVAVAPPTPVKQIAAPAPVVVETVVEVEPEPQEPTTATAEQWNKACAVLRDRMGIVVAGLADGVNTYSRVNFETPLFKDLTFDQAEKLIGIINAHADELAARPPVKEGLKPPPGKRSAA